MPERYKIEPILKVGVKILMQNGKGEYLFLRRSAKKYRDVKNAWDIPGGRIKPGSKLFENLRREVMEETGLSIVGIPRLLAAQDILRKEQHVVRLTYIGKFKGRINLDTSENEEYRLISISKAKKIKNLDEFLKQVILKL